MNYQYHYDRLIEKHGSWLKPKGVYTERHRKVPGNAGGKYVQGNAFYMSARAHFVAHLFLAKITNRPEDWAAVKGMCEFNGRKSSRLYEVARMNAIPLLKEAGKKAALLTMQRGTGLFSLTKEQLSINGQMYGKLGGRARASIPGALSSASIVGHNKRKLKGLPAFPTVTKEQREETSRRAGITTRDRGYLKTAGDRAFELKAGFHSLSEEQKLINASAGGKAAGMICKATGLGICGLSKVQRSEYGALGGKTTGAFPWWYNPTTSHCTRSLESPGEGYVRGRKKWK